MLSLDHMHVWQKKKKCLTKVHICLHKNIFVTASPTEHFVLANKLINIVDNLHLLFNGTYDPRVFSWRPPTHTAMLNCTILYRLCIVDFIGVPTDIMY